jgi:hypothetical protein
MARPLRSCEIMRCRAILQLLAIGVVLFVMGFYWQARAEGIDNPHHSVWFQGQYVPFGIVGGDNSDSPTYSGGPHIGIAGGYAFRLAESMSVGLGATFHGYPGGADSRSANVLSVPLLVSFDPHASRTVRLVMTAGLGYQEIWGNHTYGGSAWERSGCEVTIDFGVAVQVAPNFELLASVGARVMPAGSAPWIFALAAPIGLGFRYTP